ncbi:HBL/NHE enterotoxin family protein [Bacillus thuringiensis]|uniref:HBL/NHE enterotoxin family protein n=1 Tax=Bacillus thuringiensis TaxID=1428 RepID=UPI00159BA5D6|nr:HBL/NHE enterotoxin family protein [Bacillus thuringiensis]
MKKILVSSLTFATISTSILGHSNVFADSKTQKVRQYNQQSLISTQIFSNWIKRLGSQIPLIQSYGLMVLTQPDMKIDSKYSLINNQKIARENVQTWLDEYSPRLIEINEGMLSYSSRFNTYYNKLYNLTDQINENEQTKVSFKNTINRLQNQLQDVQNQMENTSLELNRYKSILIQDSKRFSLQIEALVQTLSGSNGDIMKLRTYIQQLQKEIHEEIGEILSNPNETIKGSIKIGTAISSTIITGVTTKTVDFNAIEGLSEELMKASNDQNRESMIILEQKQQELKKAVKKLTENEIQVIGMTFIEDQVTGFTDTVQRQSMILDYLTNDWKILNQSLKQIQENLNSNKIDIVELKKTLVGMKKASEEINKQTHQFQDFVANIKVN